MTSVNEFVRKRWVWIVGLGTALVASTVIYATSQPPASVPAEGAKPPVVQQPLVPTTYQQVRTWFGPWELAAPASTGAPRLVMLQGNAVEVSSWIVTVDDSWKQETFTDVQAATGSKDTVRIRLNTGDEYEISYNQPFIIDDKPEVVYAYALRDMQYVLVSIPSVQAHQTGHKK